MTERSVRFGPLICTALPRFILDLFTFYVPTPVHGTRVCLLLFFFAASLFVIHITRQLFIIRWTHRYGDQHCLVTLDECGPWSDRPFVQKGLFLFNNYYFYIIVCIQAVYNVNPASACELYTYTISYILVINLI